MNISSITHGENESSVIISFDPSDTTIASACTVECVVDLDRLDNLKGIEVLFLSAVKQLEPSRLPEYQPGVPPRFSYDPAVDAAYVKISDGSAPVQRSGLARFELNVRGEIVRIAVVFPSQD
jgi:hypothetical protein